MDDFCEEDMSDLDKPFAYKSFIDRYYHKYYYCPQKSDLGLEIKDKNLLEEGCNLDQFIFMHSNKYFLHF